ncbi:hypothetical protein LJR289_004187 [Pseudoduganella sp. LjRoot289]|uniref:hypothetical protein n=1 Tax=Pseudoduganella sp. LjRoot289 TaxID=3342314 RepID=UPI003ECCA453
MKKKTYCRWLSAALLGGCASTDPEFTQSASIDDENDTPTGTGIPRRDSGGVGIMDKDGMERAAQQMGTNNAGK